MYIPQRQLKNLERKLQKGKVVVLYGPRRTGKTTLLHHFLEGRSGYKLVSGEDRFVAQYLSSGSIEKLKSFIGDTQLLVIDEAQKIENIGLNLKLLVDHLPHLAIIATGSSAFDLAQKMGEPLTGRKKELRLFPLAQLELDQIESMEHRDAHLENRILFGSYPEVVLIPSDSERRSYLLQLVQDALFRDILEYDGIKKARKLIDLLQLIAFQIGKEVSYSELATKLGMSKTTVERYLDLLEKTFILVNVRAFSRNLRSEISKSSRYYFYDVGIRNAVINNFNSLKMRNDVGELWENYLVIERIKRQHYLELFSNHYFWRTYDQKEIDWVEESDGELSAFEFKWGPKIPKAPKLWMKNYPEASFSVINRTNYVQFIT
ncbi:MAG: hypothetical protein S4CHLAM81_08920 [Chlamydiales bacterium]|nr:hypothetical protein [Chlamydiales bacterium]MCH9635672.1 hypothetical protein [Chlamydiales bacterium]MCH9703557.1 ATP-binding protein [Chlamydiota bacterium]